VNSNLCGLSDRNRSINEINYIDKILRGAGVPQSIQSLGYGLDDRGSIPGSDRERIFLFTNPSRTRSGLLSNECQG